MDELEALSDAQLRLKVMELQSKLNLKTRELDARVEDARTARLYAAFDIFDLDKK